jgi:DNA repair protein RadC
LLDRSNHIIGKHLISKGGQAGTVADPKMIFKVALQHNAASILLAHNHPSGNVRPSESDDKITRNLVSSGILLNLLVADHLIFGHNNNYYSYRDHDQI